MNVLKATELYSPKWLKRYVLLYFTTKKKGGGGESYSDNQRPHEHLRQEFHSFNKY